MVTGSVCKDPLVLPLPNLPPHGRFWGSALCGEWNAMWHRDTRKWDLVQRVHRTRPRVKGRDAALHRFKAGRMLSVASRLHEILGLGDGGRCRWREELVRKDGRGLCEGRGMEERESQRKVLSPKGKPARSHLCGVQALLPQAAAAQRPQPPRAWPGRVPADTPGSLSSVRQCARSSQHGHRPSAGGRGARK